MGRLEKSFDFVAGLLETDRAPGSGAADNSGKTDCGDAANRIRAELSADAECIEEKHRARFSF
jgi:hypothetical protein